MMLLNLQNALLANFFTPDMYDYRSIHCEWFCLQPDRFSSNEIFVSYPLDPKYTAGVKELRLAIFAPIKWTVDITWLIISTLFDWFLIIPIEWSYIIMVWILEVSWIVMKWVAEYLVWWPTYYFFFGLIKVFEFSIWLTGKVFEISWFLITFVFEWLVVKPIQLTIIVIEYMFYPWVWLLRYLGWISDEPEEPDPIYNEAAFS